MEKGKIKFELLKLFQSLLKDLEIKGKISYSEYSDFIKKWLKFPDERASIIEKLEILDRRENPNCADWEWLKRYSLWEANRKEFEYPENYLESNNKNTASSKLKEQETEKPKRNKN